jgi:cytochrome c-type biogenesis protein CcmH/NrfG
MNNLESLHIRFGGNLMNPFRNAEKRSRLRLAASFLVFVVLMAASIVPSFAQGGVQGVGSVSRSGGGGTQHGFLIYGDVKIANADLAKDAAMILDLILYTKGMQVTARQRINPNGRYRFMDIFDGDYWLVVEFDGVEVMRDSLFIPKNMTMEIKHDISLDLRPSTRRTSGPSVVSADVYSRNPANEKLYEKAGKEIQSKSYAEAIVTLRDLVSADAKDFQAWADLGMVYFVQKKFDEAEDSYANATAAKSNYFPAMLSLGRVRLAKKNYEGAVESLEAALKLDSTSASANYFLGESYLQLKKGSKAAEHFNEALKRDPAGMADAHLRLGALYNAAGFKDRAALEYEEFLKKRPDYAERVQLEKYIKDNKKP